MVLIELSDPQAVTSAREVVTFFSESVQVPYKKPVLVVIVTAVMVKGSCHLSSQGHLLPLTQHHRAPQVIGW